MESTIMLSLLLITIVNLLVLSINVKLYTEVLKDRNMNKRMQGYQPFGTFTPDPPHTGSAVKSPSDLSRKESG